MPITWSLDAAKAFTGSWSLKLSFSRPPPGTPQITHYQKLYTLGVAFTPDLVLQYQFQTPVAAPAAAGLYWILRSPDGTKQCRMEPLQGPCAGWKSGLVLIGEADEDDGAVVVELGAYYTPSAEDTAHTELWVGEVLVAALEDEDDTAWSSISSIYVNRGVDGKRRLSWNLYRGDILSGAVETQPVFWSPETREYAFFILWKETKVMGVAYAREWVLADGVEDEIDGWRVDGVTWNGKVRHGGSHRETKH